MKNNLEEKDVFQIITFGSSWSKVGVGTQGSLEPGTETEAMKEAAYYHACHDFISLFFLFNPRPCVQEWHQPQWAAPSCTNP